MSGRWKEKLGALLRNKYLVIGLLVFGLVYVAYDQGMAATSSKEFCTSCHVMKDVGDSLVKSTHKNLSCGDCHVPHDALDKIVYKTKSGISHIYHNTFDENLPADFVAKDSSKQVIQQRCIDCHSSTVSKINHDTGASCISCHRDLPHNTGRLQKENKAGPAHKQ